MLNFTKQRVAFLLFIEIDIPPELRQRLPDRIYHANFIESMESSVSSIVLPDWICNDSEFKSLDLSRFVALESVNIGNNSFSYVENFSIDGLQRLQRLKIGSNSFTQVKGNPKHFSFYEAKSFHVTNCESLKSIEIRPFSFFDFGGEFKLAGLPSLRSLTIGDVNSESFNFWVVSFELRGFQ